MDIQVFDNGGKTPDRYCLIIDNRKVYTMRNDPWFPKLPIYLCDALDLDREEAGTLIDLADLPNEVMKAIETWLGKLSGYKNKRGDRRLNEEASLTWRFLNSYDSYNGRMLNFSKSGMYFESGSFLKERATIYFRLTDCKGFVPDSKRYEGMRGVSLGEIRWCREMKKQNSTCFGTGVKYY